MRTNFTLLKTLSVLVLLVVVAVSCNQEIEMVAPSDDLREPITFNVTNETVTRGAIATSISEFCVYAYETENTSNVVIDNAHFTKNESGVWSTDVMFYWTGNEITFCAYIPSDNFTQSGTTLTYTMPTDVTAQQDLMVAKDAKATGSVSFSFARIMSLVKFSVKGDGADVESVTISGLKDAGSYDMATAAWDLGDVSTSVFEAGIGAADETTGQITNSTGYLMVLPQTVAQLQIIAENSNENSKDYDISDVVWAAGNLYNYTIDSDGIDPEDTTGGDEDDAVETYDYTNSSYGSSNCYMLHPSSEGVVTYYIPVEERINEFWGDDGYENESDNCLAAGDVWTTEIMWGDVTEFTGFTAQRVTSGFTVNSTCTSAMKVSVPAGFNHGNIVVAVKKGDTTLWSWHFWITNYNPDEAVNVSITGSGYIDGSATYDVTGGQVERYDDAESFIVPPYSNITFGIWGDVNGLYYTKTTHIMDRFLGATANFYTGLGGSTAKLQGQGALYYQFGRKDPFPGSAGKLAASGDEYAISSNYNTISYSQTVAYSVNNPMVFVASDDDDWTVETKYNDDDLFWQDPNFEIQSGTSTYNKVTYKYPNDNTYSTSNAHGKSIFDPCPLGWRVPDWRTWSDFYYSSVVLGYNYSHFMVKTHSNIRYLSSGYRDSDN